jgi:hypothetical protein
MQGEQARGYRLYRQRWGRDVPERRLCRDTITWPTTTGVATVTTSATARSRNLHSRGRTGV